MDNENEKQEEYSYESSKEDNKRSEGEVNSDGDSSEDVYNRNREKSGRDRRRREKKRSSRNSFRGQLDKKDRKRRHKKRSRRRSSFSSRSRSRSHSRSRSRSRSLSRSRSDEKYRRRRKSYDSNASNDSDYNRDRLAQDKFRDSYKYQEPHSTIMVRGLASHLTELDIRKDVLKCGIGFKDIRLIRHRETGASRGFAFVEFYTVQEASRWMDMKEGLLTLEDLSQANLIYSVPKSLRGDKDIKNLSDWHCSNCLGYNFKRRELCYKCHAPRPEEQQESEVNDEISAHPTSTIILSGLDALTTEEKVLQAFEANANLASIPIRSVRISRESITNLSYGICYVDTNDVAEGVRLYTALSRDAIEIDSRRASIAYCKPNTSASTNKSVAATALAAAQWTNNGGAASTSTAISDQDEIERLAEYSASLYAKTSEEHASYLKYYRDYYRNKSGEEGTVKKDVQNTGESYGGSTGEISKTVAASGSQASHTWTVEAYNSTSSDCPDTSRFQYDDSCGYYYDPVSELYYDPSTHYFYDSKKQQFLYWSSEENRYIPVKSNTTDSSAASDRKGEDKKKSSKRPEKQDKVKVAKKIAKEMEKWAKTSNQKKDDCKVPVSMENNYNSPTRNLQHGLQQKYDSIESGFSNSRQTLTVPETSVKMPLTPYDDDSGNREEKMTKVVNTNNSDSSNFADYTKIACLLCKRQFSNVDMLDKHMKLSGLHKENLNRFIQDGHTNHSDEVSSSASVYRDRAQERRMKFGPDQQETKNSLKDLYIQARNDSKPIPYNEPPKDDVGNRMLKKMGWQEGQGLGRLNQGRTDIISTGRRVPNVGLGLRATTIMDEEPDSRYGRERKLTLARYKELE